MNTQRQPLKQAHPLHPISGISRRAFLATTLAPAALAACSRNDEKDDAADPAVKEPLFTISLAQWSLHKFLRAGTLDHLDFPAYAKDEFGIDAVEYVNSFFNKKNADASNSEHRERCDNAGVQSLLTMCDGEGNLGDANERKRP